jgi:DNA invertase Pin-like site-specific DNA recombinase
MTTFEFITPQHLERLAVIYIRQSTPQQTLSNQESLRLQYALQQRARELGWTADNIEVIDADLGLTAAAAGHRAGFKELVAKVTLGKVGIILSLDVTRLSRNCTDWYPLLDLCGFKSCLIADRDGIYDPATANGRLLLGLKGQISELELHTIRARLTTGLLNKAQRGELALKLPVGLIRNESGVVEKHPNLEVQQRLELVFSTFLQVGSASRTARALNEQELTIPRRDRFGDVTWQRPTVTAILSILRNPAYAGAFVYGRRQNVRKDLAHRPWHKSLPREEWKYVVHDQYPAYIDWAAWEKIQQTLDQNRADYSRDSLRGIPREGAALLQGIVYCGESGHRLGVQYKQRTHYCCVAMRNRYGGPACQRIPADPVDAAVVKAFFEALAPAELNVYQRALREAQDAMEKISRAHLLQLERLRYEAALAERQFRRVDPDNRLVAAELERRWEDALRTLRRTEQDWQERSEPTTTCLSLDSELKTALIDLGRRLPQVWGSGRLSHAQKKAMLRCLIEKVVVHRAVRDRIQTRIVWRGGSVSELSIPLAVGSFAALSCATELESRTLELVRGGHSDMEIARRLSSEGIRSARSLSVPESTVRRIRLKHRLLVDRRHPVRLRPTGNISVKELAQRLAVPQHWVYYQIQRGRIEVPRDPVTGLYLFPDQPKTVERLKKLRDGKLKIVRL